MGLLDSKSIQQHENKGPGPCILPTGTSTAMYASKTPCRANAWSSQTQMGFSLIMPACPRVAEESHIPPGTIS